MRNQIIYLCSIVALLISACSSASEPATIELADHEVTIQLFNLPDNVAASENEISGMAWYGDTLVMLPQYAADVLYTSEKSDILQAIDDDTLTLKVSELSFVIDGNLEISGFQGYEAIAFYENTVYLTIEANAGNMHSYIVMGSISESGIVMDAASVTEIEQPTNLNNKAHEAMTLIGEQALPFYEWNFGLETSFTFQFGADLSSAIQLDFPIIPYRVTDATTVDEEGRFWAINYLFPNDTSRIEDEKFAELSNQGTHAQYEHIERLIELQISDDGTIVWLDNPPLYLALAKDPRNWEGLVRLDNRGFLLATDRFPETLLAFVPVP